MTRQQFYMTVTNRENLLPKTIRLGSEGVWEVGLTDIQYPISFRTHYWSVGAGGTIRFIVEGAAEVTLRLWRAYWRSPTEFAKYVRRKIRRHLAVTANIRSRIGVRYDKRRHAFHVDNPIDSGVRLKFSSELAPSMRLPTDRFIKPGDSVTGESIFGRFNLEYVHVYLDIIHPRIYGTSFKRILRGVPIDKEGVGYGSGRELFRHFNNVHYARVNTRVFDRVTLRMLDVDDRDVDIGEGTVRYTLHFRRIFYK